MRELTPQNKGFYRLKRKNKTDKKHKVFALCFAVLGLGIALFAFLQYKHTIDSNSTFNFAVTKPKESHTLALLGYGGGGHDGGALTDSIILLKADDVRKKIFLISVPRDLWVTLPLGKNGAGEGAKINAAYALGSDNSWYPMRQDKYKAQNGGGITLAKYALEAVTGERVDMAVAVSFDSFTSFIDSVGGVIISRQTPFEDAWYPVEEKSKDPCGKTEEEIKQVEATLSGYLREQEFPCRYETFRVEAGTHTLLGVEALKYARSRHSAIEGGDFYRSKRQREILESVKNSVLRIESLPRLIDFATRIFKYIDTDISLRDVPTLLRLALAKKEYEFVSIAITNDNILKEGVGPNGEYILKPSITGKSVIKKYLELRYSGMSEASASALLAKPQSKK